MNQEYRRSPAVTEAEVEAIVRRVLAARSGSRAEHAGPRESAEPEGYRIQAVKTGFFGRGSVRMLGPE
ncbi:MAG: hypothetical protein J6J41_05960, partial [Clostridia bacterium]|nr:hypothetical protein [Clostridia bacterium]